MCLSGDKGLTSLGVQPELHAIVRKTYSEALSPMAALEFQTYLDVIVKRKVLALEGFAKSGQVGIKLLMFAINSPQDSTVQTCHGSIQRYRLA